MVKNTFVILGNQLFKPDLLKSYGCQHVFMAEDFGLCTYEKHHKLKIYLFLTAMREYRDELMEAGIEVSYFELEQRDNSADYISFLHDFILKNQIKRISFFEIEDRPFESEINQFFASKSVKVSFYKSPMFMFSREEFSKNYGKTRHSG